MAIRKMELNTRSKNNLKGVHPALINVVNKSAEIVTEKLPNYHFVITDGVRTLERQKQLLAEKKTKTLNSKHLTGHAVDIAVFIDGKITWDLKEYKLVVSLFKEAAKELNVEIECGADWIKFIDAPHIEINPNKYKWK